MKPTDARVRACPATSCRSRTTVTLLFAAMPLTVVAADGALDEVVVLGEKTERSLQDTPASVAVVSEQQIEDESITDFYEVLDRTVNAAGVNGAEFHIRGINAFGVSGGGNSYLASVYTDGAVLPYRAIQQGGFSTWDVRQVEILRGPQSTLQGRNALAGAVVMNSVDPSHEWDARARLGYGEHGYAEQAIAFGGPMVDDQLAFRIAAENRDFDGYIENDYRDENGDFEEEQMVRGKLLWEPAGLPEFSALMTWTTGENDYGVQWVDVTDPPDYENPKVSFNDPTHEFTDRDIGILKLTYDLGDTWRLTSTTSCSDVNYGYEWDGDAGPEPGNTLVDDRNDETFSQEFLLNVDGDRWSGVLGAYYSDLDLNDEYSGLRGITLAELGVPILLVTPPEFGGVGLSPEQAELVLGVYAPFDPAILSTWGFTRQNIRTAAVFADLTFSVTDRLDIYGGLRYDRETQENEADSLISIANVDAMPDPADYVAVDPMLAALIDGLNNQFIAMAAAASGTEPPVEADFDALLPKLGATWHWTDAISTSFTVQQGYRSGGVGSNIAQAYTYTYDPEYTWNYELSLRSQFIGGRLTANANLFYTDWEDQQVTVQLSGNQFDTETVNSGRSTVQGFEIEFFYRATEHWSGYAGVGFSETEFKEFEIVLPTVTYDLAGRSFEGAPEETATVGVTYRGDKGVMFNLNANYQGESQTILNPYSSGVPEDDPRFDPENDARFLVNLRAGYEWDKVGLYVTATNLLDEEYVVYADYGYNSMQLGAPRLVSLRVEAAF